MNSSNRGMTVIIIVAVVLILGMRYFLSNREVVTEDDVRDKIEAAVQATNVIRATIAPMDSNSGLTEVVNSTIAAQETLIASFAATRDAQTATMVVPPTITPTELSASSAIRLQRTADALLVMIDQQKTQIAALQTTIEAQEEPTIVPSRTPIPTMVDNTEFPTATDVPSTVENTHLAPTSVPTIENTPIPPTNIPTTVPQIFQSADYPDVVRHQEWLTSDVMALAPDNTRILTTSNLNVIYVYDVNTGAELHELTGIFAAESAATWSPDSLLVAVGDVAGHIVIWDTETGESVFDMSGDTGAIQKLIWSPNGTYLAAISEFELTIWNTITWEQAYSEQVFAGASLAWSPDSQSLLYADAITISRVSLTDTIVNIGIWMTHDQNIVAMDWSPDGQWLALIDTANQVNVYNEAGDTPIHRMRGHRDNINSVQWAADSVYILTASDDKTVRIWNGSTGSATFVLEINDRFDYLVSQATWTSDGEFIVINASDVLFWSNPLMNGISVEQE